MRPFRKRAHRPGRTRARVSVHDATRVRHTQSRITIDYASAAEAAEDGWRADVSNHASCSVASWGMSRSTFALGKCATRNDELPGCRSLVVARVDITCPYLARAPSPAGHQCRTSMQGGYEGQNPHERALKSRRAANAQSDLCCFARRFPTCITVCMHGRQPASYEFCRMRPCLT